MTRVGTVFGTGGNAQSGRYRDAATISGQRSPKRVSWSW